ncbi:MAG: hypothetical protein ACXV7G_08370 [Halobacteriota archaeon]
MPSIEWDNISTPNEMVVSPRTFCYVTPSLRQSAATTRIMKLMTLKAGHAIERVMLKDLHPNERLLQKEGQK